MAKNDIPRVGVDVSVLSLLPPASQPVSHAFPTDCLIRQRRKRGRRKPKWAFGFLRLDQRPSCVQLW